jgi:Protein of unknown function (DUF2971)
MTTIEPTDRDLVSRYDHLWALVSSHEILKLNPPLLAHYTSVSVMESILKTGEIWFSNPLFMNDLQEIRFGLTEGFAIFSDPSILDKAANTDTRRLLLQHAFSYFHEQFVNNRVIDTYVFCLSEHSKDNDDGILSMWRGYGAHGSGVALVFNAANVTEVPDSPFIVFRVKYASDFARQKLIKETLVQWAQTTNTLQLNDDKLYLASFIAFQLIKTLAIVSKHSGFQEENEWRIIYDIDRDHNNLLSNSLSYHIGERGVEPKLKYKIGHFPGVAAPDLSLERLLDRIILGPSVASPLAVKSVERMLETLGKPHFKSIVRASRIPMRPLSGSSF